ncbi:MAG: hypothetical protein A3I44_03850 [Candidatus Sungbacteria bacterium RIFCSPLOWO2_02_FULL_51_17]|uniref:Uncharacterized protein n=1 Tax=Candidatus Sungbacteria bacterium RIFCSPHIGHO2_02_FULL_51_29 TaxID=1802273 RepID=A0A1G2KVF2_9BACT|nr:MAG: hypothetical protein A2676_02370 [Candidatus Sungbacteria bacterium RIFCSPHIGHO2_01_FULL_51_22]OHA02431.1 MAG: hypothetical protein A3C16_02230 [Candidatus Sungbacteria bacterium RIFCSPHIGHO2_02_FULL_51_29]OHA06674.1 MAG: hypothetical protein A3B29_03135 [Candidatus Sungbacteria bacterium RIFCSPLOWO2_01_FULL_51_34]OHA11220.1 MAG: hypothetical protein A3I44_03850 [Candidatus Sungbacteria bacterium RIFCSPLOWO2_02_FULL_51_17]
MNVVKKILWTLVIGLVLGLLMYWGALLPERWHEQERARHAGVVAAWEADVARHSALPGAMKRIDALIDGRKYQEAEVALAELFKSASEPQRSIAAGRLAEIQYRKCERHIIAFDYFYEVKNSDAAGAERDAAARACDAAKKFLGEMKGKDAEFFRRYNEGNTALRKAITAASQEAQMEALAIVIKSYIAALETFDKDRSSWGDAERMRFEHTAINLELLFALQKNAESAAKNSSNGKQKQPLNPDQFDLKPRDDPGGGATGGSSSRSRL